MVIQQLTESTAASQPLLQVTAFKNGSLPANLSTFSFEPPQALPANLSKRELLSSDRASGPHHQASHLGSICQPTSRFSASE